MRNIILAVLFVIGMANISMANCTNGSCSVAHSARTPVRTAVTATLNVTRNVVRKTISVPVNVARKVAEVKPVRRVVTYPVRLYRARRFH